MKVIFAFILISVLSACTSKLDKLTDFFTKEEQEQYVNTLSLYLNINS